MRELDGSNRYTGDHKFRTISEDFEDVPSQRSIEIQNVMAEEVKEAKSVSLGTMNVQTESKQIATASVETNEMASQIQIQKEVKEAFCDGSIQTESKGSQSRAD
jgi:hypothetical protein